MRGRRSRQGGTKKSVERLYYEKLFRDDEVVEISVLKKLKLTAKETVRWQVES